MSPVPRILFAPAPVEAGGGHLMRCLSLAAAVAERGARTLFAAGPEEARLIERFAPDLKPELIRPPEIGVSLRTRRAEAVVVDDYGIVDSDEKTLRRYGCKTLMVIDDLADRPHLADIVLDPGQGRTVADYVGLVPKHAAILAGPAYALLRPEFARLRDAARPTPALPERVFVSFGLGDVDGITIRTMDIVRMLAPDARFDVAVGAQAQSLPALRGMAGRDPSVTLHVESAEVPALMAQADLAVGGGGGSTWERACLGLPSLTVILAENQRPTIEALADDGALLCVDMAERGWAKAISETFTALLDPDLRRNLRARSLSLCDGLGAGRAAEALLGRLRSGSQAPGAD